ncbi:MAG: helix-turn-helix domain-containing protein [Janthinobacterium lividum]
MFQKIERYEETGLGLPYPIILVGAAEEEIDETTGERIGVSVPNMEGLVAAIAITRALLPQRLDGAEVRFIRRALNMTAKDLAESLEMAAATLSRWENNKEGPGAWADKQVRMAAIIKLRSQVPHWNGDDRAIVHMKLHPQQDGAWPHIEMGIVDLSATGSAGENPWAGDVQFAHAA